MLLMIAAAAGVSAAPLVVHTVIWLRVPSATHTRWPAGRLGRFGGCGAHGDADGRPAPALLALPRGDERAVAAVELDDTPVAVVRDLHVAGGVDTDIAWLLELHVAGLCCRPGRADPPHLRAGRGVLGDLVITGVSNDDVTVRSNLTLPPIVVTGVAASAAA
ncbi:MAG TPA: hypothetical protein VI434_15855 [Candidatus Dormibacteraeota bacterium]